MFCNNCKVKINGLSDNCPLCGKHIQDRYSEKEIPYPVIEKKAGKTEVNNKLKILLCITSIISIFIFTLNMLIDQGQLWCIIPIISMWFVLMVIGVPVIKRKLTPFMIFKDSIMISIFLVIVDLVSGHYMWAMSYVVPFVLFGFALSATITAMSMKMSWRDFYLFQMTVAAVCLIPIVIRIFFVFIFWPSLLLASYCLITILSMVIFSDNKFKYETKKRLHF